MVSLGIWWCCLVFDGIAWYIFDGIAWYLMLLYFSGCCSSVTAEAANVTPPAQHNLQWWQRFGITQTLYLKISLWSIKVVLIGWSWYHFFRSKPPISLVFPSWIMSNMTIFRTTTSLTKGQCYGRTMRKEKAHCSAAVWNISVDLHRSALCRDWVLQEEINSTSTLIKSRTMSGEEGGLQCHSWTSPLWRGRALSPGFDNSLKTKCRKVLVLVSTALVHRL